MSNDEEYDDEFSFSTVQLDLKLKINETYDLNRVGDQSLKLLQLLELVMRLDVLGRRDNHTSHQPTQRGDTVTLALYHMLVLIHWLAHSPMIEGQGFRLVVAQYSPIPSTEVST